MIVCLYVCLGVVVLFGWWRREGRDRDRYLEERVHAVHPRQLPEAPLVLGVGLCRRGEWRERSG